MHGLPALLLGRLTDESAMVRVAAAGAIRYVPVRPILWLFNASFKPNPFRLRSICRPRNLVGAVGTDMCSQLMQLDAPARLSELLTKVCWV